jgi:hypothetical protein
MAAVLLGTAVRFGAFAASVAVVSRDLAPGVVVI